MRGRTFRGSLAGLDLRGTCRGTDIGQSNVPSDCRKSSSPSFQDERDYVASVPDASPRVDP